MSKEDVDLLVDELCERFASNFCTDLTFSLDQAKELLHKLFTRFELEPVIYFSVDVGWFPLLEELHSKLFFIDPNYTIGQIKEKFGGLRFYATFSSINPIAEKIGFDVIHFAEQKSFSICEICGKYGSIQEDKHYLSARCHKHRNIKFNF